MTVLSFLADKLFGKEGSQRKNHVMVELNARLLPLDRSDLYEIPLDEFMDATHGYTRMNPGTIFDRLDMNRECLNCEIIENAWKKTKKGSFYKHLDYIAENWKINSWRIFFTRLEIIQYIFNKALI